MDGFTYNKSYYIDSCGSTSSITVEGLELDSLNENEPILLESKRLMTSELSGSLSLRQEIIARELNRMDVKLFPNTIPSIEDTNGPYIIDSEGAVTLTCNDKTKSYSLDNGKTWIPYQGTFTLEDGTYELGTIKLRSQDEVYISSLPQITTPCKPITVTHRIYQIFESDNLELNEIDLNEFKDIELTDKDLTELDRIEIEPTNSYDNLVIECEVGPNMQVYYSIDDNVNWVIIPSNSSGKSTITFLNTKAINYHIRVSPIRYDYDKMGPLLSYEV